MTQRTPENQPANPNPLKDFEVIETVEGVRALADEVRLQMVHLLTHGTQTGSSLARLLKIPANRAHYHVKRLLEAGLIQEVGGVRGYATEERQYVATARHILVDPGLGAGESRTAQSLRQSIDATFSDWRRSQVLAIDWADLARLVVRRSLRVVKGDEVLVMFAPITFEAAEAISLEVEACGAIAYLRSWSRSVILGMADRCSTAAELDSIALIPPELDQRLTAVAFLSSSLVQGAPPTEAQQAKLPRLLDSVSNWKSSIQRRGLRYLHVGLPHRAEFTQGSLTPEAGLDTFWHCVTEDSEQLRVRGEELLDGLLHGPEVEIAGRGDARMIVTIDPAHLGLSDGVISEEDIRRGRTIDSVPAGAVVALPIPQSGDGDFQADYTFAGGRHIHGVKVTLKQGEIVELDGPEGTAQLRERLARETGEPARLSSISIGLNERGSGPTGRPELDSVLAGVVTLGFGNNELLGGSVRSTFNLTLPAHGLTLTSGARALVRRGRLALSNTGGGDPGG